MKARDFLQFSGLEIANENRSAVYARLLAPLRVNIPTAAGCGCESTDEGPYTTPAEDSVAWYDPARAESEQFLGVLAYDIQIDPVIVRGIEPKFLGGATVGKMRPRHRIVAVSGLMMAQSEQGMAYGERWLTDVLAGVLVGCAPDEMRVLMACPDEGFIAPFRTLRRVGIVDGPIFSDVGGLPSCYVQQVRFQIAAGIPHLLTDEVDCITETLLLGGS